MVSGTRRPWRSLLLSMLLLGTGAGASVSGSRLPGATAAVLPGNTPVNAGAADALDISSHNSPTLVQDPSRPANLVVVSRIDTPRFSCGLHRSSDGGSTWSDGKLPFPAGEEDPPRCFAPDAVFAPDGTLYVSFVTLTGLGNSPNALWLVSSSDGGRTFATPVRVAGSLTFQPRLSVDSRRPGRLFLSWLQGEAVGTLKFAAPGNPVVVSRSDDGGRTWSRPRRASAPGRGRVVAPSTAVGKDGEVFLLYLDVRDDALDYHGGHEGRGGDPYPGRWHLVLARSGDGGDTWTETTVDDGVVPTRRFIVFFPPAPSLAVDPARRRVYVAFHDGRRGDSDVWVWASGDSGRTFRRPVRVNDTPAGDATTQYLPEVAVAPGGRVDVVYYDRRDDRRDVRNGVSLQSSHDGGKTFGARLSLADTPFDSRIGFYSERGLPDLGSRLALVSLDPRTMAVWTDTRAGTIASGKQDLARAVVAFTSASPLRGPLRAGGVALAVAGGLVLGAALLIRRRPAPGGSGLSDESGGEQHGRERDEPPDGSPKVPATAPGGPPADAPAG